MPATTPVRIALASLAALALAAPVAGAFGIGLQPTTVEIEVEPGDRQRQVINIANVHTEKTISLTLGLADWSLDENGQIRLDPPGESEESAATWVRFSPAFVTLKPGQAQQVVVDMATPSRLDRSGDFRFALLASTVLPDERGTESGVWKRYQIASLFYLTAGDARSEPAITGSGLTVTADGLTAIALDIENPGNAHARLEGLIDVTGAGDASEQIPISNLVVLNGSKRRYIAPLTQPLPADAKISVSLDNIFAPQMPDDVARLPAYAVSTEMRRAEAGTTDDTAN